MRSTRIACLIAQHPAINHALILREVRKLRERCDVYTASIRAPDRPVDKLSPEEADEAQRTFYVKPAGVAAALSALFAAFVQSPVRFTTALAFALRLAGLRLKQVLLNIAYFAQAAMVGRWMRRHALTHLHCHYSSTVALLVHRIYGFDISISFHGPDEFLDPAGFWIREKVAACTFVRAISLYARSQLMASSDVADWSKIETVYMGVDPEAFGPRPFERNPSPFDIIIVGRLAPVKAQPILIAAVDLLVRGGADVLLHVVGGGPNRAWLERDVAERGLGKHVTFHGFLPQEKLDELYRRAHIFALPSFAEGLPGVLMEAMAMEIPCVATWITGIPELIRNGIDGLLVPPSNPEALAAAIRELLNDPHLRAVIGQAGRRRVLEKFDLRKNSYTLADLIEKSMSAASAARTAKAP